MKRLGFIAVLGFLPSLVGAAQTLAPILSRGAMTFQNAWIINQTYTGGDTVTYAGGSYVSLKKGNTQNNPATSPTWWALLAQTGVANFGSPLATLPLFEFQNIPHPQLVSWFQALHNARNQVVRLAIFGDSFVRCDVTACGGNGPTVSSNRWVEQLRTSLGNLYGSHGTGYTTFINSQTESLDSEQFSSSGTIGSASGYGPYQTGSYAAATVASIASGGNITWNSSTTYDTVNLLCMNTPGGGLTITVDGSNKGTFCNTSSSGVGYAKVTTGNIGSGTHSVVIAPATSAAVYVYAIEGSAGTVGISIDDWSIGGMTANYWGGDTANNFAFEGLAPANLGIFAFLSNDVGQGVQTAATHQQYLTAAVQAFQALSTSPSALILTNPNGGNPNATVQQFAAAQLATALATGADYVSMIDRMGVTYNANSGLWANNHPNDKLSLDEFSLIWTKTVDAAPNAGTFGAAGTSSSTTSTNTGGGCTANCTIAGLTVTGSLKSTATGALTNMLGGATTSSAYGNDATTIIQGSGGGTNIELLSNNGSTRNAVDFASYVTGTSAPVDTFQFGTGRSGNAVRDFYIYDWTQQYWPFFASGSAKQVGINQTSPQHTLDVGGDFFASSLSTGTDGTAGATGSCSSIAGYKTLTIDGTAYHLATCP